MKFIHCHSRKFTDYWSNLPCDWPSTAWAYSMSSVCSHLPSLRETSWTTSKSSYGINTLRPRQNGRLFPDDIFKWIFLNENVWISINISLKFVPRGSINNIPTLVQVMAWRRPGDKPLSEPMMARLPTHICVTRPQWVNAIYQCAGAETIIPLLSFQNGGPRKQRKT